MKENRYLIEDIEELCFASQKMAFIAGPRQVGKTTLAKALLAARGNGEYYNWDETVFRRTWTKNPSLLIPQNTQTTTPLIVLDEIHKARLWKRTLKGMYDTLKQPCDLLVTGSAKLNVYRRGSDSLMGRYHYFLLHPFSLNELMSGNELCMLPDALIENLLKNPPTSNKQTYELLMQLMQFGGFPEPFLAASTRKLNLWQRSRIERLIREDLRDLSRLPELSQVEMLASLLPERVSNPLSINSLSEDLEVAFNTTKRWLIYLKELFYLYEIKPYSTSLPRAIRKEGKLYLWDWSEVPEIAARFENLIASHLLKYVNYLTDVGYGKYDLHYVRNKEKKEIDFVLTQNRKPWLAIEVKLNDEQPSANWPAFMKNLSIPMAIQVVQKRDVYKIHDYGEWTLLVISADRFLQCLV